jgi:hypothetical protein
MAVNLDKALRDLGVSGDILDPGIVTALDRDGYAVLPGFMSPGLLRSFRDRLAELEVEEGEQGGTEVNQEPGAYRLSNLVDKGEVFEVCFTNPMLLAAIGHVLSDFKLSSCSSRAALPGHGHQQLHADWWGEPIGPGDYQVCNSIWLLDDFTAENGATRFVPGTHLRGHPPESEMADPTAAHPDEVLLTAPAGTVVVFNGHIWHGGTRNRGDRRRRSLNAFFTRRHNPQQVDQAALVRPEVLRRFGPAVQYVLGLDGGAR